MSTRNKITVVLWAILALNLGGCATQIGGHNNKNGAGQEVIQDAPKNNRTFHKWIKKPNKVRREAQQ